MRMTNGISPIFLSIRFEFCNLILISKIDLISLSELGELKAVLRSLNSGAEIIPMVMGNVPVKTLLNTGRFNFDKARQAPGWLKELRGEHTPENRGIRHSQLQLQDPPPVFTPNGFYELLHDGSWETGTLLRSKGFFLAGVAA